MLGTFIFTFSFGFGFVFVLGLVDLTGEQGGLALALTGISDTSFSTLISLSISMINYAFTLVKP